MVARRKEWAKEIAAVATAARVHLKPCLTVENLGIDFAFGAKSAEPTREERLQKVKNRKKRIEACKSANIPTARFYKTAYEPVGMYGVGVTGINSTNLYRLRALASGANSSTTAGKNIGLDLLLANVDNYDPLGGKTPREQHQRLWPRWQESIGPPKSTMYGGATWGKDGI